MATKKTTKKAPTTQLAGDEKQKALATAIAQIEKDFGKGTIMKLGDNARMSVQGIPTGSLTLDLALGIGGLI